MNVVPVAVDLVKPNGLIGTPDGKILYVADPGVGCIYRYTIEQQDTELSLTDKTLFTNTGSDGMTLDDRGNVYVTNTTTFSLRVFAPDGSCILYIPFSEMVTNLVFGGNVLYLTGTKNLYSLDMQVSGAAAPTPSPTDSSSGFGDPHMVNILGEHFNIWRLGEAELLRIPRNSTASTAGFSFVAHVSETGQGSDTCNRAPYMTAMRLGGSWFGSRELFVKM